MDAQFHRRTPGPPLSEFVDFLWICEGYVQPHARERVLPLGTMDLIFSADAHGRSVSGVTGARSKFLVLDTSRPFSAMGVHFKAGGGFPFFGVPSCDLQNRTVSLDLLWGSGNAAGVQDRLCEVETPEQRFNILERALLASARGRLDRHPAVRYALNVFDLSHGARPVRQVVERIGMSPRHFVELFRSEVGLSPKLFCRIRRFNEALKRVDSLVDVGWLDVALSCGYFDQAHFNHDFREFSGLSPSRYLRHRTSRTHVAVTD